MARLSYGRLHSGTLRNPSGLSNQAAALLQCGPKRTSRKTTTRHVSSLQRLPYQVNKARLVEKIAELVRDKKIDGITDLRDESDRNGMRIVIELRRDVNPGVVLNNLYKHTAMQSTFGINMLAIVNKGAKNSEPA